MKILVFILCCVFPAQALAHFVCLEPTERVNSNADHSSQFRIYLYPSGRVSVSQVSDGKRSWTLVGAWEGTDEGRLDFFLRDTDDVVWQASGTRDAVFNIPQSVRLKLDFRSEMGRSFALICSSTEIY